MGYSPSACSVIRTCLRGYSTGWSRQYARVPFRRCGSNQDSDGIPDEKGRFFGYLTPRVWKRKLQYPARR